MEGKMVPVADLMCVLFDECTCGGHGPGDPKGCPACTTYHRLFNPESYARVCAERKANEAKARPKLASSLDVELK